MFKNEFCIFLTADGIMRTEAAVALFLQKASVARRCYGIIASTRFVGSGHVPEGNKAYSLFKTCYSVYVVINLILEKPNEHHYTRVNKTCNLLRH